MSHKFCHRASEDKPLLKNSDFSHTEDEHCLEVSLNKQNNFLIFLNGVVLQEMFPKVTLSSSNAM